MEVVFRNVLVPEMMRQTRAPANIWKQWEIAKVRDGFIYHLCVLQLTSWTWLVYVENTVEYIALRLVRYDCSQHVGPIWGTEDE